MLTYLYFYGVKRIQIKRYNIKILSQSISNLVKYRNQKNTLEQRK